MSENLNQTLTNVCIFLLKVSDLIKIIIVYSYIYIQLLEVVFWGGDTLRGLFWGPVM